MKNTVITGYRIEGTGTTHFFTADQRASAYAAARDMAAMRGKNVAVTVLRGPQESLEPSLDARRASEVIAAQRSLEGPPPLITAEEAEALEASAVGLPRCAWPQQWPEAPVVEDLEASRQGAIEILRARADEERAALEASLEALETLEAPEALEGSGPSVPEVYEVTVPVRVIVRVNKYNMTSERPVVSNEWSGFFSEAEDNSGVWDVDDQEWGSENHDVVAISEVARQSVQNHLDVAYFK